MRVCVVVLRGRDAAARVDADAGVVWPPLQCGREPTAGGDVAAGLFPTDLQNIRPKAILFHGVVFNNRKLSFTGLCRGDRRRSVCAAAASQAVHYRGGPQRLTSTNRLVVFYQQATSASPGESRA